MTEPGDAVDRILLREARAEVRSAGVVAVLEDETGRLTRAVADSTDGQVRAYCDSYAARHRVRTATGGGRPVDIVETAAAALADAQCLLLRMPKSLAALEEVAGWAAAGGAPDLTLFAGGRDKHLSRGMNAVLARHFGAVRASRGQQKCRVLVADQPSGQPWSDEPRSRRHDDLGITLCAFGGTFAGPAVDLGSRFLAGFFDQLPAAEVAADLGCGNGILSVMLARHRRDVRVIATDDSAAAVRSTRATAQANGLTDRIEVHHTDRLKTLSLGPVGLVVCNPPFHRGSAKDSSAAFAMVADAARVLRTGGELWVVFNSHLPYRESLRRSVGPTSVLGQNASFTVTRSVRTPHRLRTAAAGTA